MAGDNEQLDRRPTLSRGVRLRYDPPTRSYVLLSPERGLRLNSSATEILMRCNGLLTVRQIAVELHSTAIRPAEAHAGGMAESPGSRHVSEQAERGSTLAEVTQDVLDLLTELARRQLIYFSAGS